MFKWLALLFIIFITVWILFREDFPDAIRDSKFADYTNAITFPLETFISQYNEDFAKRSSGNLKTLASKDFKDLIKIAEKRNKQLVFFFYSPDNLTSRVSLNGLNRKYDKLKSKNSILIFVAVSDEPSELSIYLSQFSKVRFTPYTINSTDYKSAIAEFIYRDLKVTDEVPLTIFRGANDKTYKEIDSGFFTVGRIETLMDNKI